MIKIGDNGFLIGLNRCKKKHINNGNDIHVVPVNYRGKAR